MLVDETLLRVLYDSTKLCTTKFPEPAARTKRCLTSVKRSFIVNCHSISLGQESSGKEILQQITVQHVREEFRVRSFLCSHNEDWTVAEKRTANFAPEIEEKKTNKFNFSSQIHFPSLL